MYRVGWVALYLAFVGSGLAQQNAQCSSSTGFSWAYNSLNQDPCTIASDLGGACTTGTFIIPTLNSGFVYQGPAQDKTTPCVCSSVYFSVLSACAECQGGDIGTWSKFNTNCTSIYLSVFPEDIPVGTAVPHWAYLNVTADGDIFNVTLAKQDASSDPPESTGTPKATGSTTPSSPIQPSNSAAPVSKSKAGAIAGGVVGGVVVLALAVVGTVLIIRRRRLSRRPPSSMVQYASDGVTPMLYAHGTTYTTSPSPRLYDPSDPSTYPSPSPPISDPVSSNHNIMSVPAQIGPYGPGRYSGAPEI